MSLIELKKHVIQFCNEIESDVKGKSDFLEWFDWPSKKIEKINPNSYCLKVENHNGILVGTLFDNQSSNTCQLQVKL